MRRKIPVILGILSILAISALGAPPPRPGGAAAPPPPGGGAGGGFNALADYLGLTDSQKTAHETIESEFRATVEPLHEQLRGLHEQLETALEGSDANAIGSLMLQIRAAHDQIRAARDAADAKFVALLTTEQKTKFEAFQAAVEFLRSRGPGGGAHP